MIAHVSIPAIDPRSTALLLADVIDGDAFQFPVVPGAWIAVARDNSGTAVEVYPRTMAHHPGKGVADPAHQAGGPQTMPWEDQIFADGEQIRPSAFHFAITTTRNEEEILRAAERAGFRAIGCDRGGVFRVVEVWLEDTILVEVLTPEETKRYRSFMNPAGCALMFGPAELTASR